MNFFEKNNEQNASKTLISLIKKTIDLVNQFEPDYEYNDRVWSFYLKVNRKWILFGGRDDKHISSYYFFCSLFEGFGYDYSKKVVLDLKFDHQLEKKLPPILVAVEEYYQAVKQDPIRATAKLNRTISPSMREGVIHRKILRELLPDYLRYDKDLTLLEQQEAVSLLREYSSLDFVENMTATKYFEYCRVAYLANKKDFGEEINSMTGREMYARWSDGRHGKLTEIDRDSPEAFSNWYHHRPSSGDHPWEIYRGGNTTHIDLYVRPADIYSRGENKEANSKWEIGLSAFASTRLAETCRIGIALKKAGLLFKFNHRESYLKRLLCEDFIGIIPEHDSVHRGWQRFPDDFGVADCIQFSWFKNDEGKQPTWPLPPKQIAALIYWLPERPLLLKAKRQLVK